MTEPPALSCVLPPSRDFPDHAKVAEELGYKRVWAFDSPALYTDVWVALARAAERTERIGLATGVAVPSLRHVMVTASAMAALHEIAPGRLIAAFGTGFTARRAMGRLPMKWADVEQYVVGLRALLRGETVEIDGAACQLVYSPGFGPRRPIKIPLLLAPIGPKGFAAARRVADGVVLTADPAEPPDPWWDVRALLIGGTVLRPGETEADARVRDAVGPLFTTGYHAIWEFSSSALNEMPGGREWLARVEAERVQAERHLAVHEGHLVAVTGRDAPMLDAAGPALLRTGWTGDAASIRERLAACAASGITEVMYGPAGSDIASELAAFAAAAGS